jgi:hypothetical protein
MGKHTFLAISFSILTGLLYAQNAVSIRLKDVDGQPVSGAMVTLFSLSEKTRNWKKVSDSVGSVFFFCYIWYLPFAG